MIDCDKVIVSELECFKRGEWVVDYYVDESYNI